MTKRELIERLEELRPGTSPAPVEVLLEALIEDVEDEGILDVQCPPDVAKWLDLPRTA